MNPSVTVEAIYTGRITTPWPGRPPSAIAKTPVLGPQALGHHGFADDEQADPRFHGGPEKAVHHYAADHYPRWSDELDGQDLGPGAFGENLTTTGLTETDIAIGDTFRLGSALVQISQGRQPCWKLNAHTGDESMAARFQESGRTGWYYRVLETGTVSVGDTLTLVDRPTPDWSVHAVTRIRLMKQASHEELQSIAALPTLSPEWRAWFQKMAELASKD